MKESLYLGYGCSLHGLRYQAEWQDQLLDALPYDLSRQVEACWKDEQEYYESKDKTFTDFWTDYLRDFDDGHGDCGPLSLLAMIINDSEFSGRRVLFGRDNALYAIPRFPKREQSREKIPLEGEIEVAIRDWLDVIAENSEEMEIGYQFFGEE